MIPIFRKKRHKLANDNQPDSQAGRFVKYSRYAIGEIVLVVIGILIALQINNWNEDRKNRVFEKKMLNEVANSLKFDLQILERLYQRMQIKEKGLQALLEMTESDREYPDSTVLKVYNQMSMGILFSYNKGGYEAIKSVGLDRISNDSVRSGLIDLYESSFPASYEFIEGFKRSQEESPVVTELHNALWQRSVIRLPDGSRKIVSVPISRSILKQQELIDRMKIEQDILNNNKYRLRGFEYAASNGLKMIERELEKE